MLAGIDSGGGGIELPHQPRILDPGLGLDARRNVHDIRRKGSNRAHDIVWAQAAGEYDRAASPVPSQINRQLAPRKRVSGAAQPGTAPRVEENRVSLVEEQLGGARNVGSGDS